MSWYCGSHDTQTVCSSDDNAAVMSSKLCAKFDRVTTTPFGADVEPDVYWRNATFDS